MVSELVHQRIVVVFGYQHLLEILKDQSHPEYEERLEWVGDEFDSEKFDPSEVRFYDHEEDILESVDMHEGE